MSLYSSLLTDCYIENHPKLEHMIWNYLSWVKGCLAQWRVLTQGSSHISHHVTWQLRLEHSEGSSHSRLMPGLAVWLLLCAASPHG